jgi:class 3 adenylate cyclase
LYVFALICNCCKIFIPNFVIAVNTIHEAGGDIVKFAFDSMLVLWPTDSAQNVPMSTLLHRAAQCALDLCHALQNKLLYQDIYSSSHMTVKIGLGSGRVAMIQLGGVYSRLEYVFVGSAIAQVCIYRISLFFNLSILECPFFFVCPKQAVQASGAAAFGECLMSQSAWDLVKASQSLESSAAADSAANCVKLDCVTKRADHVTETATYVCYLKCIQSCVYFIDQMWAFCSVNPDEKTLKQIQNVMAPVITPWLELNNDEWTGELRQVTVLAVNIPFKSSKLTVISEGVFEKLQAIISAVQTSVYHYEGSVTSSIVDVRVQFNENSRHFYDSISVFCLFFLQERGINIQLTFGLPSTVHENDPSRGLLCALKLKQMLLPQKINATIGVATGAAFCGIIGTDRRREFAVLGETSNLATHLMQSTSAIGILCDRATHNASMSEKRLSFESVGDIKFSMSSNSKTGLIPAFVPSYVQHAGNLLTIPPRVLVSIGRDSEISILLDCVRAAASGEGGRVVLIDGDVGVGKSHLMQHVWTKCQSEKTLDALWSSGDNFSMLKSFYVWKQMFASILRTFSPDERPEDRQEWFAAHIKADYPDLVPHLSLCNELLQVEFESPQTPSNFMSGEPMSLAHLPRRRSTLMINPPALDDSIDSSNAQRQAQKLLPLGAHSAEYEAEQAKMARSYDLTAKLCVAYLKKMFTSIVAETPLPAATYSDTTSTAQKATPHARSGLVMFFDRAQHMSASDWILLDRVCALVRDRSLRRLTVVVGCRSQYKKYMAPSAAEAVPTEYYDRLRKQHATDTLALKPLSAASTAQMVAYVVNGQWGVNSTLVHERTGGLFC